MAESYYEHARIELLDLFPRPPVRMLDVGCGAGATSAAAKARWPGLTAIGIEVVADAARTAQTRLDRVILVSAEAVDFEGSDVSGIDSVVLADVLEHLVDPWQFLRALKKTLVPGAVIVASIPNAGNLWLIEELASGRFDYASEGLLDATHLRFFTRSTMLRMFAETGYCVESVDRVTDGRVDDLTTHRILGVMLPRPFMGRVRGRRVALAGVTGEALDDLRTIQYLVRATIP